MGESGEASPRAAELIDFTTERGRHRRFVGREDVLAKPNGWAERPSAPTTLARTLARWPSAVEPTARRYALRHALIHRFEARKRLWKATPTG